MGKKKNSATKAALKHLLKGTTIGGGVNIYDDDDVAVPKGELSIGKGNTSISGSVEKPYLKKSKENINSTISLGLTKESDSGSMSLTGSKTGKSKNIGFSFSKTFNKGSGKKGVTKKKKFPKARDLAMGDKNIVYMGDPYLVDGELFDPVKAHPETYLRPKGAKNYNHGGEVRGTGKAIKGTGFKGVY
jgi:hypothetical protein|tara:strand:- start:2373 stop:2936 length:564 start_codon:yes stop_codon:yes gene_type:complete